MKPMLKVSAAVLLAVISAMPAMAASKPAPAAAMTTAAAVTKPVAATTPMAATDAATVTVGAKAGALPFANLLKLVGKYTKGDLNALDHAKTVWTYDTKTVYTPADQTKLTAAATSSKAKIDVFHSAISKDTGLSAWFAKNNIDVSSVVAVQIGKKGVAVYTM